MRTAGERKEGSGCACLTRNRRKAHQQVTTLHCENASTQHEACKSFPVLCQPHQESAKVLLGYGNASGWHETRGAEAVLPVAGTTNAVSRQIGRLAMQAASRGQVGS